MEKFVQKKRKNEDKKLSPKKTTKTEKSQSSTTHLL